MITKLKRCFSDTPANLGRQTELDIAKGLAIIFMVVSHAFEILAWFFDPEASLSLSAAICDSLLGGSFAAPVFMFCMGISLCYSRKNSASDLFRRGLQMLGITVLLEIFRTAIPGFLEWLIFRDPACVEYVYLFFCVDILQFVTLALFTIALFKKLRLKPAVMLAIAAVCSVAGQLLQGVSTGSYIADMATGFLWQSYEESYLPLLNWLIFPVAGYAFGPLWQRLKDKDTFFRTVTPISWAVTAVYFLSMAVVGQWYYLSGGDYYGLGLGDAVFAFVVCFAMIGLGYCLAKQAGKFSGWLASMGARVNSVYCIHWTLYGFLYLVLACVVWDYLPQWTIVPTAVVILLASDGLSRLYRKSKQKRISTR